MTLEMGEIKMVVSISHLTSLRVLVHDVVCVHTCNLVGSSLPLKRTRVRVV